MIYIHWLILFVYVVVVIASILAVVLDNRQPAKTMAWVLVLIFLPVIGFILYFFFGQNTRKEKMISQNSMDQLTKRSMLEFAEQEDLHLPEEYDSLIKLFTAQNWALPFKDNQVDIYTDGYHLFHALL
ncbi:MAG: PLDc N-terminal domain-containing protein, partial [Prevotella sp.]|nr:PLDc N-terminal domain-containing protein [Prevotella sp.]